MFKLFIKLRIKRLEKKLDKTCYTVNSIKEAITNLKNKLK